MGKLFGKILLMLLMLTGVTNGLAHADIDVFDTATLGFHGYIRSSAGISEDGEGLVEFTAPGAVSNYRLGNEADTSLEVAFDYKQYLNSQKNETDPYAQAFLMLDGYTVHDNGEDISMDHVAQAYIAIDNVLGEGSEIWAGRRYYDRLATYMTDHFWLNTAQNSQAAAGIGGIKLGGANFNLVVIRAEDNQEEDAIDSTGIDLRIKNIGVNPGGNLNLWGYYNIRPDNSAAELDEETGYGVAIWHSQSAMEGKIDNTVHLMYREGTAVAQSSFTPNPLMNNGTTLDVNYFEVATDLVAKVTSNLDLGFTALYRNTEESLADGDVETTWYSIGVRPQYALTQHLSLVCDLGYDRVDNGTTDAGLTKGAVALQVGMEKGYWSRPVLRFFTSYAVWDDEFKGDVGGAIYADETEGWNAGVQVEWWW